MSKPNLIVAPSTPRSSSPAPLFRPALVDRLSSPEQLQLLMQVTDGKSWLALAGCGALLLAAVTWGIFGSVPSKVAGSGILLPVGGLASVVSVSDGQLTALEVAIGDRVRPGQVIARVAQPELVSQIAGLEKQRRELQAGLQKTRDLGSVDARLREQTVVRERARLLAGIAGARQRSRELRERLRGETALQQRGMISRSMVQGTREELRASQLSERALGADLKRVALDRFSALRARESEARTDAERVAEVAQQIQLLEEKLAQAGVVTSPHEGRVVDLRATVGEVVRGGMAIAVLERREGQLEALLYVDSRDGKLVRPGMSVEVAPTNVQRERHGAIVARVHAVDELPATRSGMILALHNEQLVDALRTETAGAPIAVRATLELDPDSATGYRWTSGDGPTLNLTSGTRFSARIVTRRQRPLALVFPILDRDE